MSVLIRGMQMPKNCEDCCFYSADAYDECPGCTLTHYLIMRMYGQDKPSWCPLVDLGSHGDLIDRDALSLRGKLKLINEAEIQIYGGASWRFAGKCITAIEDAPTILEAEGAEE